MKNIQPRLENPSKRGIILYQVEKSVDLRTARDTLSFTSEGR
jgi:hypothetical protein